MVDTHASRPNAARSEAGYTLVELLVAMVVSFGVAGGAAMLAGQMQTSYRVQLEAATAQQEGRYALQWIERYLRAAGNNPYRVETTPCPGTGTPFQAIRLDPDGDGQDDDIRLQSDANPTNGLIGGAESACTEANEDVTITYDPSAKTIRVRDNNADTFASSRTDTIITGLRFIYRNPQRVITTNPANIAFIETEVTVETRNEDQSLREPVAYTVSSEVRVRTR